jgi:hypothetical protein
MKHTTLALLGLSTLLGCKTPPARDATPVEATPLVSPDQPQPTAAKRAGDKPSAKEVPVAEDFQPAVTATIVRANYRAELDTIESELHTEAQ